MNNTHLGGTHCNSNVFRSINEISSGSLKRHSSIEVVTLTKMSS